MIVLDLIIVDNKVIFMIYDLNIDNFDFYENMCEIFYKFGDFNFVLNYFIDIMNDYIVNNVKVRKRILKVIDDLYFLDYFKI